MAQVPKKWVTIKKNMSQNGEADTIVYEKRQKSIIISLVPIGSLSTCSIFQYNHTNDRLNKYTHHCTRACTLLISQMFLVSCFSCKQDLKDIFCELKSIQIFQPYDGIIVDRDWSLLASACFHPLFTCSLELCSIILKWASN